MTEPAPGRSWLFAIALPIAVCTLLLGTVALLTHARIVQRQHTQQLRDWADLLPPERYDNDPLADRITLIDRDALGSDQALPAWRARRGGKPSALLIEAIAEHGYAGPIRLRIGIGVDGELIGVRVLSHTETAGLGDAFARDGGAWLGQFPQRSLGNPVAAGWSVRKDGGHFDQFSGATVTPRAIVTRIQRVLQAYAQQRDRWFALPAQAEPVR